MEKHVKIPVGMSILEASHENDIELEGTLACHLMLYHRAFHFDSSCFNMILTFIKYFSGLYVDYRRR